MSNLTYKDYSFANHREVYHILEEVFVANNITYYLIGANARDVQLYRAGIKPTRITADIDFAVMVPDFTKYQSLIEELCSKGFQKTNEIYRLAYEKTNTVLDLLPYGEIEQNHTVNFDQRNIELSVLGFKEVGEQLEKVYIKEAGFTLPTTPMVGLIILKLVSWSDNLDRTKDIEDISLLLNSGWEFYEQEAYEKHLDLFDDSFQTTTAAARIIGRKMKPILEANEKLYKTIIHIIDDAILEKPKADITETTLALKMDKSLQGVQRILYQIKKGILDVN
ncbi:nucleotidyl transferase AbiEii/AbiGii toxin family protein [Pseudozobellia thermophila]|uniref:Predicted nucleotidyltransferase n=1 Tax=Pseudozobellia thermophila TaxID=192903 RepID=A0A1M6ACI3_9FLAO|nr:nucleotidyl transferase AbiEii/AbiGii toxin family protein [Pseudozobellia thermophila]SHI34220.1 Predicted nucleotidyltransferase [Pseudozobellia thermophila]